MGEESSTALCVVLSDAGEHCSPLHAAARGWSGKGANMRVLVIGTGSIGRRHIDVVQSAGGHEVVICEVDKSNADEAGEKYGVSEVFYDYKEALKTDIDVAIVCTPNAYHADATIAALEAGCDVLVEKPIDSNTKDAKAMVEAAERTGRTLMVGYTLRVYPGVEELKGILSSGIIGKPVSARVTLSAAVTLVLNKSDYRRKYETGGGIIYDYSHEIDYLRYFFGDIKRYACFVDLQVKKELTCDDVAEIILQYKSGVMASIHMDYVLDGGRTITVICENGMVEYDFNGNLRVEKSDGSVDEIKYDNVRNTLFGKQFELFAKARAGEDVSYVTGEDGLAVLQICENLYEANASNIVGLV